MDLFPGKQPKSEGSYCQLPGTRTVLSTKNRDDKKTSTLQNKGKRQETP
jgi:hypothetical protein